MAYGNGGATGMQIPTGSMTYMNGQVDVPVPRIPLIAVEMDRQAKLVEQLHGLISDISALFSAVLRPDGSIASGPNTNKEVSCIVPLASGLADQNVRLEGAIGRLQSILDRAEL